MSRCSMGVKVRQHIHMQITATALHQDRDGSNWLRWDAKTLLFCFTLHRCGAVGYPLLRSREGQDFDFQDDNHFWYNRI
jgi:hypothetical protein